MSRGGGGRIVVVREAAAPRPRATRRRHRVKGFSSSRGGRTVAVRPHYSRETRRRRSRGGARNVVVVPAYSPRRRHSPRRGRMREMFAYDAPRASLGGLVLLGAGVLVGAELADFIHRWAVTINPTTTNATLPAGIKDIPTYNAIAPLKLTGASIGYQLGLAVLGILGGAFLPWAPVRMFSYGLGLGAAGHLGVQLINQYVIEPMMSVGTANVTANGQRYFGAENAALPVLNATPASTTPSGTSSGLMGAPQARGLAAAAPAGLPQGQPRERVPATLGAAFAPGAGGGQPIRQPPPPIGRIQWPGGGQPQQPPGIMQPGQPQQPPGTTVNQPQPVPQPNQPGQPPQPAVPGNYLPPPQGGPPQGGGPSFGPPGGGQPAPQPQAPCASCGPDCTCVSCQQTYHGHHGEPPPPARARPAAHPLFAALRAA